MANKKYLWMEQKNGFREGENRERCSYLCLKGLQENMERLILHHVNASYFQLKNAFKVMVFKSCSEKEMWISHWFPLPIESFSQCSKVPSLWVFHVHYRSVCASLASIWLPKQYCFSRSLTKMWVQVHSSSLILLRPSHSASSIMFERHFPVTSVLFFYSLYCKYFHLVSYCETSKVKIIAKKNVWKYFAQELTLEGSKIM